MTTTRLPKTITAGALLATPIPPVKWIIPGLLPAGLAIFAGPSKAGKSWLTLWLCLQISQGKSVWGREIEPRTVLYFSLEDTLGRLQERLYQLVDAEEDPERLILQTESHGIGQGLEEQIVSFIHTYPDISLIVIDTLQKVRKSDQNGSMYANDYKDIGALKELADKYGICILLVHHLRQYTDIGKWRSVHYLALGGLNYLPIDYFLQQHPQVKNVVLCFDRDEPGLRFAETVTKRLAERGCNVEKRLPAVGKDYNESLIWYKSKIEKQRGERV